MVTGVDSAPQYRVEQNNDLQPTSGAAPRYVPRHITSSRVFWHGAGDRYTWFADDFARSPASGGLPFRCHVLRHRFVFPFARQIGDLPGHQAILGRTTFAMEMRYSHLTERLTAL